MTKQRPQPAATTTSPGPMADGVLRALSLTTGRRVDGLLAGDFRAPRPGQGTELATIRVYEAGDDVRRIDWNVTARTGEPHVRVTYAERVVTTWVVLDTSPSMNFGTADRRKADVGAGLALALGHVGTRHGNSVAVVTCGEGTLWTVPPRQGRAGLLGVMHTLDRPGGQDGTEGLPLGAALARVEALAPRTGFVTVVSDFRGGREWVDPLRQLAYRHEVLALEVRDPREQELPDVGYLSLVDPESGRQISVDTGNRRLRERFTMVAAAERESLRELFRDLRIEHAVFSTEGDWLRTLAGLLRKKTGGRG